MDSGAHGLTYSPRRVGRTEISTHYRKGKPPSVNAACAVAAISLDVIGPTFRGVARSCLARVSRQRSETKKPGRGDLATRGESQRLQFLHHALPLHRLWLGLLLEVAVGLGYRLLVGGLERQE